MKTVGLEIAIQLKEAGFLQVTDFYWGVRKDNPDIVLVYKNEDVMPHRIAAPTADEILDLLPVSIRLNRNEWLKDHSVFYQAIKEELGEDDIEIEANSLADAAAKMWLYLKKEGLL